MDEVLWSIRGHVRSHHQPNCQRRYYDWWHSSHRPASFSPHPRGTESELPTTSRHSATGHPPVSTGPAYCSATCDHPLSQQIVATSAIVAAWQGAKGRLACRSFGRLSTLRPTVQVPRCILLGPSRNGRPGCPPTWPSQAGVPEPRTRPSGNDVCAGPWRARDAKWASSDSTRSALRHMTCS